MVKKRFKTEYFASRIFPHIKAIMDTIPARRERLTHVWWQLREFIFRTRAGLDEPDLPARISFRTSGIREEFEKGITKQRLREIIDEVLTMHLGAIAWYPKEAPFIAEHCKAFFEKNKEQMSDTQLAEWEKIAKTLVQIIERHKVALEAEARAKFQRLQKGFAVEQEKRFPRTKQPFKEPEHIPEPGSVPAPKRRLPFGAVLAVVGILLVVIFLVVKSGYLPILKPEILSAQNESQNVRVFIEEVPQQISFSEYIANRNQLDGTKTNLTGFLRHKLEGTGTSGVYVESLVDDYDDEIHLKMLSDAQKALFIKRGTTTDLYQVLGTFKRRYGGIEIEVSSIVPGIRPTKIVERQEQIPDSPMQPQSSKKIFDKLFSFFKKCNDGTLNKECSTDQPLYCKYGVLIEDPAHCGCPEGSRLYENKCTPIITCSDGTLYPECSRNKPYRCGIGGDLVEDARICGCQQDYVAEGDVCKKIVRCSDGTISGRCSSQKPLFCDEGKLIKKSSQCGCPYGRPRMIEENNDCIDLANPDTNQIETRMHELVNLKRKENGLSVLRWHDDIAKAARMHSEDMARRGYFSHDSPEGTDFTDRYRKAGFHCAVMVGNVIYGGAENIHQGWTASAFYEGGSVAGYNAPEEIAQQAVEGWMSSPGHRQNILTPQWTREGIGLAISSDGKIYATQNFC